MTLQYWLWLAMLVWDAGMVGWSVALGKRWQAVWFVLLGAYAGALLTLSTSH